MNPLREAAQQALEALEKTHTQPGCEQWQAERKASVALRAALAQQEQKPFGYIWPTGRHPEFRYTQLFTAPPRREWKGLSDTEVLSIHQSLCNTVGSDYRTVARAVEQALKEKNHG
jgi:hypothetical protein